MFWVNIVLTEQTSNCEDVVFAASVGTGRHKERLARGKGGGEVILTNRKERRAGFAEGPAVHFPNAKFSVLKRRSEKSDLRVDPGWRGMD